MLTRSRKSAHIIIACAISLTLAACDTGKFPSQSTEVALQGIYSASISEDGGMAIIGSIVHGGSLWDLDQQERKYNWNHKQGEYISISSSAFSPAGKFTITSDTQNLVLWSTSDGTSQRFWTSPDEILSVDLMPEANFALLGLENFTAVLFDVQRGGVKRVFQHDNRVRSVSLSNDGKLALTGGEDGKVKLWSTETGELLHTIQHDDEVRLVKLSPKGDLALSVSKYDRAIIWRTDNGELLGELPIRSFALQRGLTFQAAQFSTDSGRLLTGTSDRIVQLWNTQTLKQVQNWTVPRRSPWKPTSAAILALGFAANGSNYWAVASNGFIHKLEK